MANGNINKEGLWRAIAITGLLAGTLDIVAAFLKFLLEGKTDLAIILKYIASGVIGRQALSGGWDTAALGLFLHYVIALGFTAFLFLLYPRLKLAQVNPLLTGAAYGIFVWLVMNLLVVPFSRVSRVPGPFKWDQALIGALILILCIGIPISLMARKYYLYKK